MHEYEAVLFLFRRFSSDLFRVRLACGILLLERERTQGGAIEYRRRARLCN